MNQYRADAVVSVRQGQVMLSEDQARRRLASNQVVSTDQTGVFDVREGAVVQFKAGETFGWTGDAGKAPGFVLLTKKRRGADS